MKITSKELWDLVRCSEWLPCEDAYTKEEKANNARYRRLHKKLLRFYQKNTKPVLEIK